MNKQPFYHQCEVVGDPSAICGAMRRIKSVIKSSVEYGCDELLFTATTDVCSEANHRLMTLRSEGLVEKIKYPVNAEPGDPCDLM